MATVNGSSSSSHAPLALLDLHPSHLRLRQAAQLFVGWLLAISAAKRGHAAAPEAAAAATAGDNARPSAAATR